MEKTYKDPVQMDNKELLEVLYDANNFKLSDIENACGIRPGALTNAKCNGRELPSKYRISVIEFIKTHIYGTI